MPTIVDFSEVVKKGIKAFEPFFGNEPERRHLAEYLSGLIVAESKTICGINRQFVQTTDQFQGASRNYAGDWKQNRKAMFQDRQMRTSEVAELVSAQDHKVM